MLIVEPLTVEIFLFTQKLSVLINLHFIHGSQHSVVKISVSEQIDSEKCQEFLEVDLSPENYKEDKKLDFHDPNVNPLRLHNQ